MIYQKLFLLQNEIGSITKTETNPFFKSKYFDINTLIEQLKPLLEKHGLVILQPLTHIDGKPAIETRIIESETGEMISSTVPLIEASDAQKQGSAITYFRRYALQSILCLSSEDDDANSISKTKESEPFQGSMPTKAAWAK